MFVFIKPGRSWQRTSTPFFPCACPQRKQQLFMESHALPHAADGAGPSHAGAASGSGQPGPSTSTGHGPTDVAGVTGDGGGEDEVMGIAGAAGGAGGEGEADEGVVGMEGEEASLPAAAPKTERLQVRKRRGGIGLN